MSTTEEVGGVTATAQAPTDDRTDPVLWRDLVTLLLTVGRALDARLQRDAGISAPDYDILCALCATPSGRMRPRDLGLGLQWEKSRLSHQLRRMESRGLVERAVCDEDARGALVAATPAGRAAYERGRPGFEEELHGRFGRHIDPADRDALYGLVQRVLSTVDVEEVCAPDSGSGC
jgi:DNA-binding MarR family transcriptional regulator